MMVGLTRLVGDHVGGVVGNPWSEGECGVVSWLRGVANPRSIFMVARQVKGTTAYGGL